MNAAAWVVFQTSGAWGILRGLTLSAPGVTTGPPAQAPVRKLPRWARDGNSASLSLCSLPAITVACLHPKREEREPPFLCYCTENLGSLPGAGKANLISSPRGVTWPCLRGGSFPTTLLPAKSALHTQRAHVYELGTWSPTEEVQLPLVNQEAGPYMLAALVLEAPWEVVVNAP